MQNIQRAVFAGLHFVPNHRHFRIQICLEHGHIRHAVSFKPKCPTQVFVARVERFKIHRLVFGCSAVEVAACPVGEILEEFSSRLCALERHVLQQMRHPGLAIAFVPRAYQVNDINRDLGLGVVRKQQHAKTVRERVFRNSFNGGHLLHTCGQRLCPGCGSQDKDREKSRDEFFEAHVFTSFCDSAPNYTRAASGFGPVTRVPLLS